MMIEKKKKKGQAGFGGILVAFISIIVGVTLFVVISQTVGTSTDTVAVANVSLGATVVNGTTQYLTGYVALSDVVIYNETDDALIPSTNYTVTNHVVYNGAEAVSILPQTTSDLKSVWQVSGTAEPQGYIGGAGRSMALLIPIFFALLIAVLALEPTLRGGLKDLMGM
jgi:hypothetical protein